MKKQGEKFKKSIKFTWSMLMVMSISVVVIVSIVVNICFAYRFDNEYTNLFTVISGWISGIATLSIGVIAYAQSYKYQKVNEEFIQEQKDLAWKNNYANVCERFLNQLKEHDDIIKKYQPHKLEAIFLKNFEIKCFYDYELLVDDIESDITHFLVFLRKSTIFNNNHKEMYEALILFYISIDELKLHYEKIMNKEIVYKKESVQPLVRNALRKYNNFIDLIYIYVDYLNHHLFDINEENVLTLKTIFLYQQNERTKWYNEIKDLKTHIQKLKKEKREIDKKT